MSNDINYVQDHKDEAQQCKNCTQYQHKDGKHACVPPGKEFEAAVDEYGEVSPAGHCDQFEAK